MKKERTPRPLLKTLDKKTGKVTKVVYAKADEDGPVVLEHRPEALRAAARACLLGGAIGDALGAPVEFLRLAEIKKQYGPEGIRDFVAGDWPAGSITDDTQMSLFTAEGLIRAQVRGEAKGICHPPSVVAHAYLRCLQTQGETPAAKMPTETLGLLMSVPELFARRAPGNTCLAALRAMTAFGEPAVAKNDSKGCGGVMRMAPVGLFGAARTEGPWKPGASEWSFDLACDCAALTHGHPTGQLAAGAFAVIVGALASGVELPAAIEIARGELIRKENHEETLGAMDRAVELASSGPGTPEAVESLGGGWVAEEALAIGIYCALVTGSFEDGVLLAVNHGGDSDSTGSIAGNLLGIMHGEAGLPGRWLERLELRALMARVAEDLIDCPEFRSITGETRSEYERRAWDAYPGY